MFENRIQTLLATPRFTLAVASPTPAFVACPAPLFTAFSSSQQSFIAEVYRRAQELTAAQLQQPARRAMPEFSRN
jgi:hypothetical protein